MRIGELAELAGTTPRALRHYEEHGLLEAARADNGYRDYGVEAVNRVRNIRFLIEAGLTVEDVKRFLPCLDGDVASSHPCPPGVAVVKRRLASLNRRIDELTQTRDRLGSILDEVTKPQLSQVS
ncbi:MerR family transcriptional regulator [Fodinicola acaciae]|uniref:MerR family transcriptional regulator n=1 Tax=Fodinicola acaciae TaxID=2681555 RepID=UPI0013D22F24|nr:MerR family transcriptional regulator [Fodinicola acaciae]